MFRWWRAGPPNSTFLATSCVSTLHIPQDFQTQHQPQLQPQPTPISCTFSPAPSPGSSSSREGNHVKMPQDILCYPDNVYTRSGATDRTNTQKWQTGAVHRLDCKKRMSHLAPSRATLVTLKVTRKPFFFLIKKSTGKQYNHKNKEKENN